MNKTIRKKNTFRCLRRVFLIGVAFVTLGVTSMRAQTDVKICSAGDLHYFDPSLLVSDGTAFQSYLAQDRKLIAESDAITAALVDKIYDEAPDIFLISGDLTKDGERISHETMAKYLDSIEMNGITKVYVIPGNHDINNVEPYSYDGDETTLVDSISPEDFKSIYADFGYSEAAIIDTASVFIFGKTFRRSLDSWNGCMYVRLKLCI